MNEEEREVDAQLSAYLDGELEAGERAAVEAALARSPALAARLQRLRGVDAALRALPVEAPSEELLARLRARVVADDPASTRRGPPRRRRWLAGLAAAAAAGLALLFFATRPAPRAPQPVAELDPPQPGGEALQSPDGLALAMELDQDADLEVVEVLDILEALGDLDEGQGSG